ncbi:UDP-glucose 4-epimerase family protein [Rheinheimera aquimaris]|uniref:SDR family oxidoreductase n=1 Tax=Rheinheimera aquimaris TaxID=412437 RepID=A0ABN1DAA5_9GAMM|nr:SDR family oxidoreductase [Rheinheimera aquimaris]MCB5212569.1 SDR family oxidoreductase [Rheinheimera aquimaris]
MKIMLTGANGFIGRALMSYLIKHNHNVTAVFRDIKKAEGLNVPSLQTIPDFDIEQLRKLDFNGVTSVVHLAARAHVISDKVTNPLAEFRKVNTDATLNFARIAAAAGVKRFVFLSSVGVNGISNNKPFNIEQPAAPVEDYAQSKLEAEIGLRRITSETGIEAVIIRPPLVYGPGAPGNFGKLTQLAKKNLPLPLGAVYNKRSLVALDNLIDLIMTCIEHPKAANQTFLVSDDNDVSTTELLRMMTRAAGKHPRLLPVPVSWLTLAGKLIGKKAIVDRLCSNLQVDITHTKETLNWKPPVSMEEGIKRCFVNEVIC